VGVICLSDVELSIVIPVHNEEKNVEELHEKLIKVLSSLKKNHEIIFVDDGSTDNTFEVLRNLYNSQHDGVLKVIRFRRNFGKSAALSAGFKLADGNIIITMDGDLQDDPTEIPNFIEKRNEDYDLIVGWKFNRKDPLSKKIPSKIFNKLTSTLSGLSLHDFDCGFKTYRKEVVKNLRIYGELHRYIPALVHWMGYRVGEIKVKHHPRRFGKTKYGASRLIKGFLDLITVTFLTQYTKRPLHLFGVLGLSSSFVSFILGLYLLYVKYGLGLKIGDRPLLLLVILLVILGIQLISIGLLGEMIVSTTKQPKEGYNIKEILR
jgi:glycosyltransferase involved in cell wall biosynthesis